MASFTALYNDSAWNGFLMNGTSNRPMILRSNSLTSPDNNLQSVFHYLTKDDEAKGAARKKPPVRVKAAS